MNNWPSIQNPDYGFEEEIYRPQKKTEFEANYIQVYPTASRSRRRFLLSWSYLPETDFQTLADFFEDNQGKAFIYTHPLTNTSHTCVFSSDSLKGKPLSPGLRSDVQCPIEEM